jgi:hypothetical protein
MRCAIPEELFIDTVKRPASNLLSGSMPLVKSDLPPIFFMLPTALSAAGARPRSCGALLEDPEGLLKRAARSV